jgi:Biotin/lipoate A/B protein ligase family
MNADAVKSIHERRMNIDSLSTWDDQCVEGLRQDWQLPMLTVFDLVSSTNDTALAQAARDAPDGSVVLANHQSSGRGRHGRRWHSHEGKSLLMSIDRRCLDSTLAHRDRRTRSCIDSKPHPTLRFSCGRPSPGTSRSAWTVRITPGYGRAGERARAWGTLELMMEGRTDGNRTLRNIVAQCIDEPTRNDPCVTPQSWTYLKRAPIERPPPMVQPRD